MKRLSVFKKIYGRTAALAMALCLLLSNPALSEVIIDPPSVDRSRYDAVIKETAELYAEMSTDEIATPGVYRETESAEDDDFLDADGIVMPEAWTDGVLKKAAVEAPAVEEISESSEDILVESEEAAVLEGLEDIVPETDDPEMANGFRSIGYKPEKISKTKLRRLGSSLPSYYSSLDLGYLTNVKHQGDFGNCWAFSTVNLAESYMLRKASVKDPDYSEFALAYYLYNRSVDPLGLTEDDINRVVSGSWLDGGSIILAAFHLSGWGGLNSEDDAPYEDLVDELSVPGDIAYDNEVILKNAYFYDKNDTAAIKNAVMENGSVSFSYFSPGARAYQRTITEEGDYQGDYCFFNYEGGKNANHAVAIVGWDDDFPKEYFNTEESKRPANNGAWLVRNSWSDAWPSPDAPHAGYFWMSYEEGSIGEEVVAGEFADASEYDSNYHYDGTSASMAISTIAGESVGNIYQAHADEEIMAVNIALHSTNTPYSIQIYTSNELMENPEDGIPMLETPVTGTSFASGIYTKELPEPVFLEEGTWFSVVIAFSEEAAVYIEEDGTYGWYEVSAAIDSGQSFYKYGEGYNWRDAEAGGFCFRIKAFTKTLNDETIIYPTSVTLDSEKCSIVIGDSKILTATVLPENAFNKEIIWISSDSSVAAVDEGGRVIGLKPGTAVITAETLYGFHQAQCTVTVIPEAINISGVAMTPAGVEITWDAVPGTAGYDIYRREPNGVWNLIGSTSDLSWTDTGESIRKTYTYAVRCQEAETFTENESADWRYTVTQFRDMLDSSKYYYKPVYWAVEQGITNGFSDLTNGPNHFRPQYNCTRAQMVTFLWRVAGKPNPGSATIRNNKFKDIHSSNYYYKAVLWALEKGITKGYSEDNYTTFRPNDTCLREHAVTFMYRMAGKPKVKTTKNPFKDIRSSDYYYIPALWAYENGIAKGYGSGSNQTYGPKLDCLREHIVTFLYRYDSKYGS